MKRTNNIPYPDFGREIFIDSCDEVVDTRRHGYELHVYDVTASVNPGVCPRCPRKGNLYGIIGIVF
jgi:hypothetical protein